MLMLLARANTPVERTFKTFIRCSCHPFHHYTIRFSKNGFTAQLAAHNLHEKKTVDNNRNDLKINTNIDLEK